MRPSLKHGDGAQVLFLQEASITVPRVTSRTGPLPPARAGMLRTTSPFLKWPSRLGIMRVRLSAGFRVWRGARVAKGSRL